MTRDDSSTHLGRCETDTTKHRARPKDRRKCAKIATNAKLSGARGPGRVQAFQAKHERGWEGETDRHRVGSRNQEVVCRGASRRRAGGTSDVK